MKKILLTVLMIVAGITVMYAQDPVSSYGKMSSTYNKDPGFGSRLNFGVTFAPTISWMYPHTEDYENNGVIMGMRYGVNLNVNLTEKKNFYFSTGIFGEHAGGKMQFLDNINIPIDFESPTHAAGILTQRTYRSIYLTIPTMITMKTNSINNFYVCGNAGLMHSFNLYSTNTDSYTFGTELWSREKQVSDETALFKEAFILGVGFEYSVTPTMRAGVMVNYVQSFTNYFKGKGKAQNSLSKLDQRANLGCVEIALNINFF